ncbi:MAG: hypothetical protein ABI290_09680, partial [Ginsengibacter sp.]
VGARGCSPLLAQEDVAVMLAQASAQCRLVNKGIPTFPISILKGKQYFIQKITEIVTIKEKYNAAHNLN